MADDLTYDNLMDAEPQQQSAVKQSMYVASKTNPDAAAQDQKLAAETSLSPEVVARNKNTVQELNTVDKIDYGYLMDNNPGLSKWLENTDKASVSSDDIGVLGAHEKQVKDYSLLESLGRSFVSGAAGTGAAITRIPAFAYDVNNFGNNLALKILGEGDKQVRSPDWLRNNPAAKWMDAQQEAWRTPDLDKNIIEEIKLGNYSGAGRSMLAQVVSNAPLLIGMIAAGPEVGIAGAGGIQGAAANKVAQESGVDPARATTDAVLQGGLEALFERVGTFGILKRWEGAIAKTAGKQTSKQVMKEFGKTLAYSAFAEGNEELWTQAGQDFSDYITGVNPDALKGIWSRSFNNAIVGAASGVGVVSPVSIASVRTRMAQVRQAEQAKNFYLSMGQTAEASKLRERLPESHREYIESITKDSPVENIYIPVEAWDMFMQSKNVDPSAIANQVGVPTEYDQAKETGTDIKIPLATWANKIVGTEYYQGMADDIKFDPNGLTTNQAKEQEASVKAELEKAAEQAQQAADKEIMTPDAKKIVDEQSAAVQAKIEEQLKATGKFSDTDIKHLSSLWSNAARVLGGRQGIMPMDFFNQNPLNVQKSDALPDQAAAGKAEFNQLPPEANQFAQDSGLVSPVDNSSDVGFINGDNFIQLGQYKTHDQLVSGMGMTNSREAVAKGLVRVHNQHGGGNYEVAAGNESGYDAINQALLAKGKDGFKGSIYVDVLGQSGKSKSVDFKMSEFLDKGGDVRAFLPNEGSNLYFQPATPDKNLVAMHNLSAEGLAHADKIGGLAVPSLSIGKAEHPLEHFGDITLIGSKELIDPKKASNKVFNADIYSPRYPSVSYEASSPRVREMAKMFKKESDDLGRNFGSELDSNEFQRKGIEAVKESGIVQLHYLRMIGQDVAIPKKQAATNLIDLNPNLEKFLDTWTPPSDLYKNKEFIAEYKKAAKAEAKKSYDEMIANGTPEAEAKADAKSIEKVWFDGKNPNYNVVRQISDQINAKKEDGRPDFYMAERAIRDRIAEFKSGYDAWVESQFSDIIANEKIYSHEGPAPHYTRVYLRHNLENVVRVMKRNLQSGEGFNYGIGNLRATIAKKYRSIKEIQNDRNKIIDAKEFEKVKEFTDNEFESILQEAIKVSENKDFGVADRFIYVLQDGIKHGNIEKELNDYGFPGMDVERIKAFLNVLKDMPTEYFEAKIQRAVNLNEFSGAIIPTKTSQQTKDILTKNGIKFVEYNPNNEGDRTRAINQLGDQTDIFFQAQQNEQDPLGAIIFGKEGGFDMRLLKDMNYSTFIHETGHAFLELVRRASTQTEAPADIKEMSANVLKWLEIDSWDKLERKHHEQFAQGFEKYLFEGKAPSQGLRAAFLRFKVWLTSVYKSLQGLNVKLSDDIRGVMDRILASDEEIAQAQAENGQDQMIQDPISILGEERGQRYLDAVQETKQEAEAEMTLKLMEEYQRERKSVWMDELKKVRKGVAEEVNARPEQIALSVLQRGKMPDGTPVPSEMEGLKISTKDLIQFYANKFDMDVSATDSNLLEAEYNVESLEDTLKEIERFRDDAGKIKRYENNYLKEELDKIPRRYITSNKFAKTLDEAASDLGFESDMALADKMIENEIAYKDIGVDLIQARKELRSVKKQNKTDKFASVKEAMRALPGRISNKEGISVDVVAQMFGYSTPDQFLDVMSRIRKRNDLIKEISHNLMVERYGEIYGDKEAMHEQAVEAIHNDKKEQLLRMELDHLAEVHKPVLKDMIRTLSARIPSSASTKKYAAGIVGSKTLTEISPYQFQLAERRAAKAAGQAFTQGKFDEAFEWKRKELLNYELSRAATAARADIKKSLENFKKISKTDDKVSKSRDVDYVNAARSILALHNIGEGAEDPYSFLKDTQAYDPDTYQTLVALVDAATENVGDYKTKTYDQFVAMKEAVDAIWEISRRSRQIQIDGKKVELDEVLGKLIARITELNKGKKTGYSKSATENDKFARAIMGAVAQGKRVEYWADLMDGGDTKGWFTQAIWNPVIEGTQEFRIKNREFTQKFLDLVKPMEKAFVKREIVSDELKHIFQSKAELLGALLHTGNESNLSKLLRGRGWGMYNEDGTLDTTRWDSFIKRMQDEGVLTKQDYDFVQSIWDLFEEMKTGAQKAHKEMYGYYFNTITNDEFATPWGKYRGGYAPAIVDPFVSEDAAIRQEKEAAETTNNSYMFPTTGKGFTKGRVERYAAPLALDLRMVPAHINKVLRFTHIEPRVKDVGRIIRNQEFREYLRDLDPVVGQHMLSPWLQRAAQQIVEQPDKSWAGWRVWREIRTRSGINIMAGNVVNTLQQFTGLSIAAVKVQPKYLRNSLWNFMRNPKEVSSTVYEKSDFMKTRSTTQVIEIQKTIDDLILNQGKYAKAIDFAKQHAYFMQQGTQNVVDMVVWPGAYDQSIAQGNTDAQAIRDADAAVRQTQGDFSPENVSNLESGNAFARAFLMFYSYFNMQANLLGTEFAKVSRDLGLKRGAGRAFYVYMLGFMIPAVVSELIMRGLSGADWDKDDDGYLDDVLDIFFGSQFRTATAMFPFVGQIANAAVNKFNKKWYDDDIKSSPAISMIESASHSPFSVYKAIADDGNKKTAIRDALSLLGILTGLPVSPLSKPLGYLSDVSEGNVFPENNLDFTRGLITGKTGK